MFLTAQRVVDDAGRGGVSVYAYSHASVPGGPMQSAPRDAATFAHYCEVVPGECFFAAPARGVTLSSAYVLSFLDVLAPDAAAVPAVLQELNLAIARMPRDNAPSGSGFWIHGALSLRFYSPHTVQVLRFDELRRLKQEMQVLIGVSAARPPPPRPLRIVLSRNALGFTFALDIESKHRVEAVVGYELPASLHVDHEILQWQVSVLPDPYMQFVMGLTHLGGATIQSLGGAVVIDHELGLEVWRS